MCGICGIADADGVDHRTGLVESMIDRLRRRGPDDSGQFAAPRVALGHTRLSIIDLGGGRQPLGNEDGTVQVTFNGEIFNFRELRDRLIDRGHRFATRTDTEVIVHLYEEFGTGCVEHLNGQFAFAVWDSARARLLLARDRAGIKPLYYALHDRRIVFASELKALLCDRRLARTVSPQAVADYLTYLCVPSPRTIYEGISKLPPAHRLIWEQGAVQVERYWELPSDHDASTAADSRRMLDSALSAAVRSQLVSDVPIGCFLSSGIDSSTICWYARAASEQPVRTFSIRFPGAPNDESAAAERIAAALGTEHETFEVTPALAADEVPRLLACFDEPFGDTSAIPTYFLCQQARQRVTVCLSGDGGDELLGGYRRYRDLLPTLSGRPFPAACSRMADWLLRRAPASRTARRLASALARPRERYLRRLAALSPALRDVVAAPALGDDRWRQTDEAVLRFFVEGDRAAWPEQMLRCDFANYLSEFVLVKLDRMSMMHGLEARVPFLDHHVVEHAFRLPLSRRVTSRASKIVLKELMAARLPAEVIERRKAGFGLPLGYWFRGGFRKSALEVLSGGRIVTSGFLNARFLERLRRSERWQQSQHGLLWALMVLELWLAGQSAGAAAAESPLQIVRGSRAA